MKDPGKQNRPALGGTISLLTYFIIFIAVQLLFGCTSYYHEVPVNNKHRHS